MNRYRTPFRSEGPDLPEEAGLFSGADPVVGIGAPGAGGAQTAVSARTVRDRVGEGRPRDRRPPVPVGRGLGPRQGERRMNVKTTTPVGSYPDGVSPYGVHDLAGNVAEWVSSLYKPYPYVATDGREDQSASGLRVIRGGSWDFDPRSLRSADRGGNGPASRSGSVGFRCAQAVQ